MGNELQIEPSRGQLVRQLFVFQIKLAVDGLKDIVLAPLSLVAGLLGIFLSADRVGPWHAVLRLGRSFDEYIDLYSDLDRQEDRSRGAKIDRHLLRVERAIAEKMSKTSK